MDEAHECCDCFLTAQGDAPEALEFVEEAFDLMTLLVEAPVDERFCGAAGIGLDLCGCTEVVGDEGASRIGITGGIGDDMANALQAGEEGFGLRAVAMLPWRRMDADRQADGIDGCV